MGKGNHDADKLATCARKRPKQMQACVDKFTADGGTLQPVAEGGTFYTDQDGGKVFITNGGKVFG